MKRTFPQKRLILRNVSYNRTRFWIAACYYGDYETGITEILDKAIKYGIWRVGNAHKSISIIPNARKSESEPHTFRVAVTYHRVTVTH
jgi:hypothetical protein